MSKKDEAFRLFGEGKRPSSPEVEALGLSAKTRYNYYQDYKKSLDSDGSGASEIQELRQKKIRLTLLSQIEELEAERARLPDRAGKLERQVRQIARWLDEITFANHQVIVFFMNNLLTARAGKTMDKDSLEDMIDDAGKEAAASDRDAEKYIDRIEGI